MEKLVRNINIEEEMKSSYIDYAMSVIVGRAIPDVRDGLKPVHRRVLYAMNDMGLQWNKPYKKSARVVGEVLGKYHPHGDVAVYDSLVRMAQEFSLRYPLVDGQGNFGSIDGDAPAAMRYTEVRLTSVAEELLRDIDKETVVFEPNFDESLEEPLVLPSRIPNLLVNGASGIAVGMATSIPPHNICEIIDALLLLTEYPNAFSEAIMEIVKGPDFPTGGVIFGLDGVRDYILRGRGTVKVRARAHLEIMDTTHREQLIIEELPYQVNKAKLVESIAVQISDGRLEGIQEIRDESNREGIRIVIELRRGADGSVVLNNLYKKTQLQVNYGVIMLSIVDGKPEICNLKKILQKFIDFRKYVIIRRTKYDLKKAQERLHILEGITIALEHIDRIVEIIKASRTPKEAKSNLTQEFSITGVQSQAILDIKLQRLTTIERESVEKERIQLREKVAELENILRSDSVLLKVVRQELQDVRQQFRDERRTEIGITIEDISFEDTIKDEDMVIIVTYCGYIKRVPVGEFRKQRRRGSGVRSVVTREGDFVTELFVASTHENVLAFTKKGLVYRFKVYELPGGTRQVRGRAIVNLLRVNKGDSVTAIIPESKIEGDLVIATSSGKIKRISAEQFRHVRKMGIKAITVASDDELVAVRVVKQGSHIGLATRSGKIIRFDVQELRKMGRNAAGVRGIRLSGGDKVVSMVVFGEEDQILTVTSEGYGKRTNSCRYRKQRRGGMGVNNISLPKNSAEVVGVKEVKTGESVMLIANDGRLIWLDVDEISIFRRGARGVKIQALNDEGRVVAIARVADEENKTQEE